MTSQYYFDVSAEHHAFAGDGFKIARETKLTADTIKLTLTQNGHRGVGECVPLKRYGHTPDGIAAQLTEWCATMPRLEDVERFTAGPARFALDTALTELAAQQAGQTISDYLEIAAIMPVATAFTLSLDTPAKMADAARDRLEFQTLKLKLGNDSLNIDRLAAIQAVAPHANFILDANESLTLDALQALLPELARFPVILLEQPLPAGQDEALRGLRSSIPLAADESCHTQDDLAALQGKYQAVNLKLDKTGGLHHALRMADAAKAMGFEIMVGCMGSTSLSIYPAVLLAHHAQARYVDLDGALLLQSDPYDRVRYADGCVMAVG